MSITYVVITCRKNEALIRAQLDTCLRGQQVHVETDEDDIPSWPPMSWEVRRIVGGNRLVAFHLREAGFLTEELSHGAVILVEPPGPNGYRSTGLTTAFTEKASVLPASFDNCCVRVGDVLLMTELVGSYDGLLPFGSDGVVLFPLAKA